MWGGDREGGAGGVFLLVGSRLQGQPSLPSSGRWAVFPLLSRFHRLELVMCCVSGSVRESPQILRDLVASFCVRRSELGLLIAGALPCTRSFPGLPA